MNIPLFKTYWDQSDTEAVKKIIESGKYWATGLEIKEFEEAIASYLGIDHCLVFNSGGSALFALMDVYGFGEGDEIIVPSFTFIATAYAPLWVNAKPVFADVEKKAFGLNPKSVERKITENTKAILPIHYGGSSCRIEELQKIADDNSLILIEDTAESFGAKYKGKFVGTFGDSAIFSFCHNKIFTTSEGGCLVTDNEEIYEKAKLLRSYGRETRGDYFGENQDLDYVKVGHNFRMSSMLAALGSSQLSKVEKIVEKRRKRAAYFNEKLSEVDQIKTPDFDGEDGFSVYQMYTIRVLEGQRDELMKHLTEKGISTKIYFEPVHHYSVFEGLDCSDVDLPNTEKLSEQVLTLPLYPDLTEKEMDFIIKSIIQFFK